MEDFRTQDRPWSHDPSSAPHAYAGVNIEDRHSVDSDRYEVLANSDNPNEIITVAPRERFRLGYFDVMCLVVNRMIGTGIFNSPQRVMQGTGSTGASLLLWFAGTIYCLAGTHVFIEYGLNVPRYVINGIEQAVPRSGGDLNYLQYVYSKPAYRKDTFLLSTCIFGFGFLAFGNMASNCISFATRVLRAANVEDPDNGTVRGIAIAIAVLTCFIHSFSRRGGIFLNNVLALVKLAIILLLIVTAIVVAAGGLKDTKNVIVANTDPSIAFKNQSPAPTGANGYSHAFLAIVFSFSGFEQPNYVLGEISRPRRKFPIAMTVAVVSVVLLYMAVNLSYMVVVPANLQISGDGGVANQFFELTFGRLSPGSNLGSRILNAFLAISSLGNIIVMTYTAARVKQEIAKEGIFPWAKFWAQNTDLSVGRLLRWFQRKGMFGGLFRYKWFQPEEHCEETPVGAFLLHLIACVILIFATWGLPPDSAYALLANLSAYVINCFFGVFLSLGILLLRFHKAPATAGDGDKQRGNWIEMTGSSIQPHLSCVCALVYMLGSLWPIAAAWVKPDGDDDKYTSYKWWLLPTIAWAVILLGTLWFLGFVAWSRTPKRKHEVFVVEKKPEFEPAEGRRRRRNSDGGGVGKNGLVLVHETVFLSWVGKENLRAKDSDLLTDDFGNREGLSRRNRQKGGMEGFADFADMDP